MVLDEVDLGLFDGSSSAVQSRALLVFRLLLSLWQRHRDRDTDHSSPQYFRREGTEGNVKYNY